MVFDDDEGVDDDDDCVDDDDDDTKSGDINNFSLIYFTSVLPNRTPFKNFEKSFLDNNLMSLSKQQSVTK